MPCMRPSRLTTLHVGKFRESAEDNIVPSSQTFTHRRQNLIVIRALTDVGRLGAVRRSFSTIIAEGSASSVPGRLFRAVNTSEDGLVVIRGCAEVRACSQH